MPLRHAFAQALKFARQRLGLSQSDIAGAVDASYVSRLESGKSSVTVDANDRLARVLGLHPLSMLVLAYAAEEDSTPRKLLKRIEDDLDGRAFLDEVINADEILHPITAKGVQTTQAVQQLKSEGLSQAQVAKALGLSTSTIGRHWNRLT
ncbi:helix-turn-helix domain-containing protein [Pseudomonas sp. S2_H01]